MPSKPKVPPSSRIMDLLPHFDLALRAGPRFSQKPAAASTISTYLRHLRYFCTWLSPTGKAANCVTTVRQVDRECIQAYFAMRYARWSQNTVMVTHIALSAFFHFCEDAEELDPGDSPMRWVRCPQPEVKLVEFLAEDDIRKLLNTCTGKSFQDRRDRAMIHLFVATGMRLSELQSLQVADVNLIEHTITISHGKGGKSREVAFGPQTARDLSLYLLKRAQHKHTRLPDLWLGQRGKLAGVNTIYRAVCNRAEQAGIAHTHPHAFRHFFAHQYLSTEGSHSENLQELAGWSSGKMLGRYGASRKRKRALDEARRLNVGEQF